jgi:hypothetical protein
MMPGYTKLFSSIVHSTIWREEDHVRIVWVTMLALADKNGIVEASIPGLSDVSRVSIEHCTDALEHLKSEDRYSRSQDFNGRRIEEVEGGWLLLNYVKYRGKLVKEKVREQTRERVKRHREKFKGVTQNVTRNADVTPSNAQSEAKAESESNTKKKNTKKKKPKPIQYSADFSQFWEAYPKKLAKGSAWTAWQKLDPPLEKVVAALKQQNMDGRDKYTPYPATWLNGARWEDEKPKPAVSSIPADIPELPSKRPDDIFAPLNKLTPSEQCYHRNKAIIDSIDTGEE